MTVAEILESIECTASQGWMFWEIEQWLEAIVEAQKIERFVIEARLQVLAARLDYDTIGDPRQESQHAA